MEEHREFKLSSASPTPSPRASRFSVHSAALTMGELDERDEDLLTLADGYEDDARSSLPPTPRKGREDTARRHKRFSLPAVALFALFTLPMRTSVAPAISASMIDPAWVNVLAGRIGTGDFFTW